MNLDLHVHTRRSHDSLAKPAQVLRADRRAGLSGIAITDHDTVRGALETRDLNDDPDFLVIPGAEYRTEIGDIIGLFITTEVASRECHRVVDEIHEQGGIVVLPHPFTGHGDVETVMEHVDLVEWFNARTRKDLNDRALELARRHTKPAVAGSDAHFPFEVGTCWVCVPGGDVRSALLAGRFECQARSTPAYVPMMSQMVKAAKSGNYAALPLQALSVAKNFIVGR